MTGPELIEPDVAEVRDEMDADVGFVGRDRATCVVVEFLQVGDPLGEVVADGRDLGGDRGARAEPSAEFGLLWQGFPIVDSLLENVGDLAREALVAAGELEQRAGRTRTRALVISGMLGGKVGFVRGVRLRSQRSEPDSYSGHSV